jgi:hypothetical protein
MMQRVVEYAVSLAVEAVADVLAAGGVDRGCAGVAGEVMAGREASDIAGLAEDGRGDHRSDAVDRCQRGAAGLDRFVDACLDVLDALVRARMSASSLSNYPMLLCERVISARAPAAIDLVLKRKEQHERRQ